MLIRLKSDGRILDMPSGWAIAMVEKGNAKKVTNERAPVALQAQAPRAGAGEGQPRMPARKGRA